MIHPHARFSETVERYRKYRPDYPASLVDWVIEQGGLQEDELLLDVGCGTGIAARLFSARGLRVLGVDPNPDMLAAAMAEGGDVEYREGAAEALPVDDQVAQGAISGQAFHWFDVDAVVKELARVLSPGKACFAFWNIRDQSTPFLVDYERLLRAHCRGYPVASEADVIERIRRHPATARVREAVFQHGQRFDRDGLLGRAWSSSYVVHGVRDGEAFNAELERIFEAHQVGGEVEFGYRTPVIAFEPRTAAASCVRGPGSVRRRGLDT